MHGRVRILATALALLLGTAALARAARTDVILLRNGDRLTGEVIQLREGKLQLKTDDIGTLSIEWDKVASVTTAGRYDAMMRDGTQRLGRIGPGQAGSLHLIADDGSVTAVPMAEVVSFAQIKVKFLDRIDGSLDLGGSYTAAGGVAQVSFDTKARYRRPSYLFGAAMSANVTRQPDAPDTSRYALQLDYTRLRANRWLMTSLGLYERNEELGFKGRVTGALAVGRYLWMSKHAEYLVTGGFAAGRESPVDGPDATNVDGLIATDLSIFAYDYPTTSLDLSVLVFPSLNDPGRVRVNANGKFKRELFHDVYFAISAYEAFDNQPRSVAAKQNDFGGSLSFGWTF